MRLLRKWFKRFADEVINAKLGLVAFTINFAIVYWVNRDFGFAAASWSGIKGGASAFILGGIFGRMSERFSEIPNPWLAYPLGSVVPTVLAYIIIFSMHWFTGTPKPIMSTILPMLQSMFINTPSTIFVLRRGFLRQNVKKPAVKDKVWIKRQQKRISRELEAEGFQKRTISLVIPTYWVEGDAGVDLKSFQFDHPTNVNHPSTLPELLESLSRTDLSSVKITIIVSARAGAVEEQAVHRIKTWLNKAGLSVPVSLFTSASREKVLQLCADDQTAEQLFDLSRYGGVKNCGLAAGLLNRADIVTFIDDDEQIILDDFFSRVRTSMRMTYNNEPIDLLAGYYVYGEEQSYIREDPNPEIAHFWPKYTLMNKAFKRYIGNDPPLKQSPFAFGGNLSITSTVFSQLPFDPNIPRGEDVDYVIMARRFGIHTVMDRNLPVLHNPPPNPRPLLQQVWQDMVRFQIERQKLAPHHTEEVELKRIRQRDLKPYPGPFVSSSLELMITDTANALHEKYTEKGETELAVAAKELQRSAAAMTEGTDYLPAYLRFCQSWQKCASKLNEAGENGVLEPGNG